MQNWKQLLIRVQKNITKSDRYEVMFSSASLLAALTGIVVSLSSFVSLFGNEQDIQWADYKVYILAMPVVAVILYVGLRSSVEIIRSKTRKTVVLRESVMHAFTSALDNSLFNPTHNRKELHD